MEISDEELKSLNRAMLTRYGVDFTCYETGSFKRRVSRAISVFGLESVHNLWMKLLRERDFIYPFIDELTVGLTAMFRDPIMWKTLKNDVLPALVEKDEIKVLHAGCSSGEEVYSMGILLQEMNLQHKTKAMALDLNKKSIKTAKKRKILKMKMDENNRNYAGFNILGNLSKYYQEVSDSEVQFDESLISHVSFREHNLVSDTVLGKYDIIFCRNVMIYFDNTMKLKLLNSFHNHLNDNGFLVIGFYDALVPLIDEELFNFYNLKSKVFQKKA